MFKFYINILLLRRASNYGVNIYLSFYTYENKEFRSPYFFFFVLKKKKYFTKGALISTENLSDRSGLSSSSKEVTTAVRFLTNKL